MIMTFKLHSTQELMEILRQLDQQKRSGWSLGCSCRGRCRRCRTRLGADEPGYFQQVATAAEKTANWLWEHSLPGQVAEGMSALKTHYGELSAEAASKGQSLSAMILDELGDRVEQAGSLPGRALTGLLDSTTNGFATAGRNLSAGGADALRNLSGGVADAARNVGKGYGDAIENLINPSSIFLISIGLLGLLGAGYLLTTSGGQALVAGGGKLLGGAGGALLKVL